ncbi:hypothetical protein GCM10009560_67070 [Nonomuraea longicatena]|uniref:Uncharacterized protein n=1 Tax=Nonomuraea longicatena TaxID=83682 RepID=A0ABP4BGR8_9ACTN
MAFGSPSPEPSVYYDLDSSCWRTFQPSLLDDRGSTLSSPTLPRSGAMRRGRVYARPTSAPRTGANAGSASPGLPTPAARDWKGHGYPGQLPNTVALLLPTPTTSEGTGIGHAARGGMNLRHTISLLPTPRATDGTKGGPGQRGSSGDLMLPSAVRTLLPTPTTADSERTSTTYPRGNPTLTGAVSSTGDRTVPPSPAGRRSPAAPHPGQLTIEDASPPASSNG